MSLQLVPKAILELFGDGSAQCTSNQRTCQRNGLVWKCACQYGEKCEDSHNEQGTLSDDSADEDNL